MNTLYSIYYDERDPFAFFDKTIPIGDISKIDEKVPGVVVIWGGEDISPSIYGQKPNKYMSKRTEELSHRDILEIEAAKLAIRNNWPIIGVCRGAQLMCALSGGSLVQHVNGHHGNHFIKTYDDQTIRTNSIHHQMMNLVGTEYEMIAWSEEKQSDKYYGENEQELHIPIEPEIVFFPKTNALAIQGHPEYLTPKNQFVQYCLKQIDRKFHEFLSRP